MAYTLEKISDSSDQDLWGKASTMDGLAEATDEINNDVWIIKDADVSESKEKSIECLALAYNVYRGIENTRGDMKCFHKLVNEMP